MTKRTVTILGATGTIGDNMLALMRTHADKATLFGVSAHKNEEKFAQIISEFQPQFASISSLSKDSLLPDICAKHGTELLIGDDAHEMLAKMSVDLVVGAIVGMAGLPSVFAAVEAGQVIALANKESLVSAGHLIMPRLQQTGAKIIPVDSEHNAIFQCLMGQERDKVRNITLTASGGPFLHTDTSLLSKMTKADALAHPNWVMGAKVSIDSATMMNKGLELLEAAHLFAATSAELTAIIHPQSLVHGLVDFQDGSVISHMATADMKLPLGFALGLETRIETGTKPLDLLSIGQLTFMDIDRDKYPCYYLAKQVIDEAPSYAIALNAANEVAVEAFLADKIAFTDIAKVVESCLSQDISADVSDMGAIFALDVQAREMSRSYINTKL